MLAQKNMRLVGIDTVSLFRKNKVVDPDTGYGEDTPCPGMLVTVAR